jgi:histidine phosphotransferase ChpT
MQVSDLELGEMLVARFCHDLAGPLGAISNGAEFLLDENSEMKQRASGLIEVSIQEAIDRMQFYRQAFGSMSQGEASISRLKELSKRFFSTSKIQIEWDSGFDTGDITFTTMMGKLIFNAVLMCQTALIYGGRIVISTVPKTSEQLQIMIRATGNIVKVDDDIAHFIRHLDPENEVTPRNVQFVYTRRVMDTAKLGCQFEATETALTFTLQEEQPLQ